MTRNMRRFSLNWRLSRRIWVGEHLQAAVLRLNHREVQTAQTAQQRVQAHFKRRAEAFAERQAENLRERAAALAQGLVPPLLLLSKKTKLSDSERASKSAYRPPMPPPPAVSEPVLVVAVGDYPVKQLASAEQLHQQVLWSLLQEQCADWGLAVELSRFAKPQVLLPKVGRLPLSWLMAWLGRLQENLSQLRERLRYRALRRRRYRRRQRACRRPRSYWFARLLRRSQWRYRSRFYRDQPKGLLAGPPPIRHSDALRENPANPRRRRRGAIRQSLLKLRREREAAARAAAAALNPPLPSDSPPGAPLRFGQQPHSFKP